MLDPSSSESEEELPPEENPSIKVKPVKKTSNPEKATSDQRNPPDSPRLPPADDDQSEQERIQKEEAERKTKLQIYVFVLRCIAYPFNAKQPTDMARRQQKVSFFPPTHNCCSCHRTPVTIPVSDVGKGREGYPVGFLLNFANLS